MIVSSEAVSRQELLDVAIDVGALYDYAVAIDLDQDGPLPQRILKVQARLMVALGLYRHDPEIGFFPIDEPAHEPIYDAETARGREWLREDLTKALEAVGS